ncbi:hypothetical protein ACLOJK_006793, partial [Asimina triloba]
VIHPIPGVTLVDIRIDTLLERPSPHVSPITSILTRQLNTEDLAASGKPCANLKQWTQPPQ